MIHFQPTVLNSQDKPLRGIIICCFYQKVIKVLFLRTHISCTFLSLYFLCVYYPSTSKISRSWNNLHKRSRESLISFIFYFLILCPTLAEHLLINERTFLKGRFRLSFIPITADLSTMSQLRNDYKLPAIKTSSGLFFHNHIMVCGLQGQDMEYKFFIESFSHPVIRDHSSESSGF